MARFEDRETQSAIPGGWNDLDAEKSDWDECLTFLPHSTTKKLIQQIAGANSLLASLEILGENNGAILPAMARVRCEQFAALVRAVTNSREYCQRCVRRETRMRAEYEFVDDPDCQPP